MKLVSGEILKLISVAFLNRGHSNTRYKHLLINKVVTHLHIWRRKTYFWGIIMKTEIGFVLMCFNSQLQLLAICRLLYYNPIMIW
jgi:hypothetical protein